MHQSHFIDKKEITVDDSLSVLERERKLRLICSDEPVVTENLIKKIVWEL